MEEDLWPLLSAYLPQFQSALIDLPELNGEQIRAELFGKIVLQAMKAVVQGNVVDFIEENAPLIQELLKSREGALGLLETLLKYLFQTAPKISKEEFQAVVSKAINTQAGEQVMTLAEHRRGFSRNGVVLSFFTYDSVVQNPLVFFSIALHNFSFLCNLLAF